MALLANPDVMLVDEPTTGLSDSDALAMVCPIYILHIHFLWFTLTKANTIQPQMIELKDYCQKNKCVMVIVIHQPREEIFEMIGTGTPKEPFLEFSNVFSSNTILLLLQTILLLQLINR